IPGTDQLQASQAAAPERASCAGHRHSHPHLPQLLYLIAAGYLVALGLLFMAFKIPAALAAIPVIAGVIIFIFPELIPFTFAAFLGLFGFMLLFGFQFAVVGIITLVIAILILMNPDSVAYLIATFLLIYAISNLIRFYRARGG